jgi:Ca2+-binding RTX toxin-like protein
MPQVRRLGATIALVAAMLMVFSSVAAAHPGHHRFGPHGFDSLWIGSNNADVYNAAEGNRDKIIGRAGNDVLDASDKRDVVRGGRGNDAIEGGPGSDRLYGGRGNDRISGGDDPDLIIGGFGADGINGGDGHDLIKSGPGADTIIATDGVRDWIFCGRGKDTVRADKVDRVHKSCENVTRVAAD